MVVNLVVAVDGEESVLSFASTDAGSSQLEALLVHLLRSFSVGRFMFRLCH